MFVHKESLQILQYASPEIPIQRDLHAPPNYQGLPARVLYFGAFTMCVTKRRKNMAKVWIANASRLAHILEATVENTKG